MSRPVSSGASLKLQSRDMASLLALTSVHIEATKPTGEKGSISHGKGKRSQASGRDLTSRNLIGGIEREKEIEIRSLRKDGDDGGNDYGGSMIN